MSLIKNRFILFLLVIAHGSMAVAQERGIRVATTIKPLALIVAPLLSEVDSVEVLLPPGSSPHEFALRASHLKLLADANVILWVGPELERFLEKPLAQLDVSKSLRVNYHGSDSRSPSNEHADDPHVWLSVAYARQLTQEVGARLIELAPDRAEHYSTQMTLQEQRLINLGAELANYFRPVAGRGFVSYHPAYTEIVNTYNLTEIGTITRSPEIAAGARHLYELQKSIELTGARCLFVEVNHTSLKTEEIARQLQLNLQLLDPLGQHEDVDSYDGLMRRLAVAMVSCLSEQTQ